jgi:hypothetical protein
MARVQCSIVLVPRQGGESEAFSKRAIESLVKKLKVGTGNTSIHGAKYFRVWYPVVLAFSFINSTAMAR